jgi:hypothetical protein
MSGDDVPGDDESAGELAERPFEETAKSYLGRKILVGVTYVDHDGAVTAQRQLHGKIAAATKDGVVIALEGKRAGQNWTMPPSWESTRPAPAGEYRLRETGEVIVNPDLLAEWTIHAPPPEQ